MEYFAGSLSNPKQASGQDNRNLGGGRGSSSPFEKYSQSVFPKDYSHMSPTLAPRNGASILPQVLNPSAAYRAFAEPSPRSLLSMLLGQ
jgi:hypothetical protein